MNTAELVVGSLCGLVLLGLSTCIGIALYLGYTQAEAMAAYFQNSSSLITVATHKHTGPWGELQLVGGIASAVTFPRFFLKHGLVSAEDISNFPLPLRRKRVALQWSIVGLIVTQALLVALWDLGLLK